MTGFIFFFLKIYFFYFYFLAALGLCCCEWAFSSCGEWGILFVVVNRLLAAVASLVSEHGLEAHGLQQPHTRTQWLRLSDAGSVEAKGLSCFGAGAKLFYGMCSLPRAGVNLCPLHWQMDS